MDVILLCPQISSSFSNLVNNSMHSQYCSAQNIPLGAPRTPQLSTLHKGAWGRTLFHPHAPPPRTPPSECRIWLKILSCLISRLLLSNTWSLFANPNLMLHGLLAPSSLRKSGHSLQDPRTPFPSPPFWPLLTQQACKQSQVIDSNEEMGNFLYFST